MLIYIENKQITPFILFKSSPRFVNPFQGEMFTCVYDVTVNQGRCVVTGR